MALLNIIPTDRYEKFLARMAGDGSVPMPIPRDKKEKFLKAIAENINRGGSGGSGASAYDLAVENGFVGTVEEWLASLKGSDGKDGEKGDRGATGAKGDKGDTGTDGVGIVNIAKTSTSGLVDTYTITLSNGATKTFAVKNGADGSGGGDASTAETVSYSNSSHPTITTVDGALDKILEKLYYVDPVISSFTSNPSTLQYENGAVITGGITFNWNYNKNMKSQSLTDCTLSNASVRTAKYTSNLSANKTFTLTANDGEKTITKSISFVFMNKIYWGVAADQSNYDDAFILGLSNSKLASATKGNYNFTAGEGQYCYFAIPTSMSISAKVNGFDTELDTLVASKSFTNSHGYKTNYKIVRLHQPSLGTLTVALQ